MKKNYKNGFTLAELLIVVAIIAVLVAIAIPIFNTQLEKSRDAASLSNLRAAYAQAQASVVSNSYRTADDDIVEDNVTIVKAFDFGEVAGTVTVSGVKITTQKDNDWSDLTEKNQQDFDMPDDGGTPIDNATVTFTYEDGKVTETTYAAGGTGGGTT